jgi:hypothetical protein
MSDGGRERATIVVEVWKSSQMWSAQRSAVRSIAWLGLERRIMSIDEYRNLRVYRLFVDDPATVPSDAR